MVKYRAIEEANRLADRQLSTLKEVAAKKLLTHGQRFGTDKIALGTPAAADDPAFCDYTEAEKRVVAENPLTAQELLNEFAKNPSMDEFFIRRPPLSRAEQIAMFKKL